MQRLLSCLVAVVWSLWFGGLITLFLVVSSLFRTFAPDRQLAGTAAAGVFRLFERYQLGLAAASLVFTFLWRLLPGAARLKTSLFALFALTTIMAATSTLRVTPQIEALRRQGATTGPQFSKLHGISSMLYVAEAGVLLLGGFLLPGAVRREGAPATGEALAR